MTNNNYTEYEDELFYSFIDDNKQVDSNKITQRSTYNKQTQ